MGGLYPGGLCQADPPYCKERVVRILLEYILVVCNFKVSTKEIYRIYQLCQIADHLVSTVKKINAMTKGLIRA